MSFMYPRTITVTRPVYDSGAGGLPYQVLEATQETGVIANIPANIQYDSTAERPKANLPSDIYRGMRWKIFTPPNVVALGLIKDNDIVTDDEGIRYQVSGAYWNSLGCNLKCERLQN